MQKNKDIYGLILTGGKSTRMGRDKGLLEYHGKPQREYLFELAGQFCESVFYSLRSDQQTDFEGSNTIIDMNEYRGPFNGILSAHETYPDKSWLVLACDLPLIDAKSIRELIINRDETKDATAFATSKTKLPEPLVAIWEPKGLKKAKNYLQEAESSCPRKFLLNSDTELVYPETDAVLYNANNKEEFEHVKTLLSS